MFHLEPHPPLHPPPHMGKGVKSGFGLESMCGHRANSDAIVLLTKKHSGAGGVDLFTFEDTPAMALSVSAEI